MQIKLKIGVNFSPYPAISAKMVACSSKARIFGRKEKKNKKNRGSGVTWRSRECW